MGIFNLEDVHYWIYSPGNNAVNWDDYYERGIMAIERNELGDLSAYSSKEEMRRQMQKVIDPSRTFTHSALETWQFVHEIEIGDVIIAKKGKHTIIGRGIVTSRYRYDKDAAGCKNIRSVKWTHRGEWEHPGKAVTKPLTDITMYGGYVAEIKKIFSEDDIADIILQREEYTPEDFLSEAYITRQQYSDILDLLNIKRNIILQGAPGVGKTYIAKKLVQSILDKESAGGTEFIQFHQSYSYEDFIEGYRPTASGFELRKGVFYNFCKKAEADAERPYFFIIDEINRGNLSKIFGELFMLIESDKRGQQMRLLYSDELFSVPENVYIIGMMNTADRSLAMLDYALRRRFAFVTINPAFDSDGFIKYQKSLANTKFNRLIDCVKELNAAIAADDALGEGFCVGHSYFCNIQPDSQPDLSFIVEYEILPLISEYWFDDRPTVNKWADRLRGAIR